MVQNDILSAIRQISAERKIDFDEIVEAIKEGIVASFNNPSLAEFKNNLSVEVDSVVGTIAIYLKKKIVEHIENPNIEISLIEAKKLNPKSKVGSFVLTDVTTQGDFGRIAAQTARGVIMQKLKESERNAVIAQYIGRIGKIISAFVQRVTKEGEVICEVGKAKAVISLEDRIPNEFYKVGSTIKVLLQSIEEDTVGKYMKISRADPNFVKALFELEIPEIESGTVEVVEIARDPGSRTKIAVKSNSAGVDAIGSCIGQRGVRISAIQNELKFGPIEEKVEVILWSEDPSKFISNALQPAQSTNVVIKNLKKKIAEVKVKEDQISLAIGKDGQNIRLASRLTGWEINIVE